MPKARIAIAIGDPAGIGPEISLKAARDPAVRALCDPILCGDPDVLARHAAACGLATELRVVERASDADFTPGVVTVLTCRQPEAAALPFGAIDAAGGRASIAFAATAVDAAMAGDVDAAVGAPQNETAIARAGIAFDGHPGFVARRTGTDPDDVYLMLCFDRFRIAHCTLHVGVRDAVGLITRQKVGKTIRAADRALKRLGIAAPRICVGGLNPHAGEGGLFGREEIEIIAPALADAAAEGIAVSGPYGADIMFHRTDVDAFVVMLHDQGHITAKLLAPNATAALTIGTPILFASVAHGSAHDIAGKGLANPAAMIAAITMMAGVGA